MASPRAVILVEGDSDREAVAAVARMKDIDLDDLRIVIVAMGGASQVGDQIAQAMVDNGPDILVGGLYDRGEVEDVRRGLRRAGAGADLTLGDLESRGFFGCDTDLEEELIRALGPGAVEAVIDEQGEMRSFRSMQNQPAWRGRPIADQQRRFIGTKAGRKIRYGRLLVEALDLERVPRPLIQVLDYVTR